MSLNSLISLSKKTSAQIEFLDNYYRYMPVTMSNSPMNILCKFIESVDFEISKKIKEDNSQDILPLIKFDADYSESDYQIVSRAISIFLSKHPDDNNQDENEKEQKNEKKVVDYSDEIKNLVLQVGNIGKVVNCAIDYFYLYNPSKNKDVLWNLFGKYIIANIKKGNTTVQFPMPDKNGNIEYLGNRYSMQEVNI